LRQIIELVVHRSWKSCS